MKVGDLVRWTNPTQPDTGIIIKLDGITAYIVWQMEPQYNGGYPIRSQYMELLSESR
jgi:hypothetical protein